MEPVPAGAYSTILAEIAPGRRSGWAQSAKGKAPSGGGGQVGGGDAGAEAPEGGALQAGDVHLREAELRGDLLLAIPFVEAAPEDEPVALGQLLQRLVQRRVLDQRGQVGIFGTDRVAYCQAVAAILALEAVLQRRHLIVALEFHRLRQILLRNA